MIARNSFKKIPAKKNTNYRKNLKKIVSKREFIEFMIFGMFFAFLFINCSEMPQRIQLFSFLFTRTAKF